MTVVAVATPTSCLRQTVRRRDAACWSNRSSRLPSVRRGTPGTAAAADCGCALAAARRTSRSASGYDGDLDQQGHRHPHRNQLRIGRALALSTTSLHGRDRGGDPMNQCQDRHGESLGAALDQPAERGMTKRQLLGLTLIQLFLAFWMYGRLPALRAAPSRSPSLSTASPPTVSS